jgi:hypothetical protein
VTLSSHQSYRGRGRYRTADRWCVKSGHACLGRVAPYRQVSQHPSSACLTQPSEPASGACDCSTCRSQALSNTQDERHCATRRIAQIRPQLAKARHFAEKAEAENRAMTAEEQKAYDEIMAEGREVSDAVKAHCHDHEVFAFARELSDNVMGGLGGDLSGSGIGAKSGQRLSFKHTGASVARPMLPDGMKALTPSGARRRGPGDEAGPGGVHKPAGLFRLAARARHQRDGLVAAMLPTPGASPSLR